jgi:hypothetical protein
MGPLTISTLMYDSMHQQALRIGDNVALFALDLLARIIAMRIDVRPLCYIR